jgi:hypothetical protein
MVGQQGSGKHAELNHWRGGQISIPHYGELKFLDRFRRQRGNT